MKEHGDSKHGEPQNGPSTAKFVKLPKRDKSSGKNFWVWMKPTWDRDNNFNFFPERTRESSPSSVTQPSGTSSDHLPKETFRNSGHSKNSGNLTKKLETKVSSPKSKTTIVVHMRKTSTDGVETTPNSNDSCNLNNGSNNDTLNSLSIPNTQRSLSGSISNLPLPNPKPSLNRSSTLSLSGQSPKLPFRNRTSSPSLSNESTNPFLLNRSSGSMPLLSNQSSSPSLMKLTFNEDINRNKDVTTLSQLKSAQLSQSFNRKHFNHRSFEDVHRGVPFERSPVRRGSLGRLDKITSRVTFEDESSADVFPRNNQVTPSRRDCNVPLNSLQVSRQQKYRNRNKSERKIMQMQHLQRNSSCSTLIQELNTSLQPNTYLNQTSLNAFQKNSESTFITCRKYLAMDGITNGPQNCRSGRFLDHIYSEIEEFPLRAPLTAPIIRKRVKFRTMHEPILELHQLAENKKILPATLYGIVEVMSPLREKKDEERRGVAKLCYHALKLSAPNYSIQIFGKIDRSRHGESIYLILEKNSMEIRDGEGEMVARHKTTDVSVVMEIPDEPSVFAYVGRCNFTGRIGMVLRFHKRKYINDVFNFFRRRVTS